MPAASSASDLNTPAWIQPKSTGFLLLIVVQPRASKSSVVGPHGEPPRLKIRIAAPPVDGEANLELLSFLAKTLAVSKAQLSVFRGESSKKKDIFVSGVSRELLTGRLGGRA